jgi:hypothetical protein
MSAGAAVTLRMDADLREKIFGRVRQFINRRRAEKAVASPIAGDDAATALTGSQL